MLWMFIVVGRAGGGCEVVDARVGGCEGCVCEGCWILGYVIVVDAQCGWM